MTDVFMTFTGDPMTYQSAGGEWSNDDVTSSEQQTTIKALPNGGYVIAWVDGNGGENNIRAQVFDAAGVAVGAEILANAPTAPFSYEVKYNPTIEVLANDNFVIAWDQSGSGSNGSGILARVFDQSGAAVSEPFLAGTYSNDTVASGNDPAIVQAGGDQFWVISNAQAAYGNNGLFRQLVDSGGTIQARQAVVYSEDFQVQGGAEVATLADGKILVVWREYDADTAGNPRISAQLFNADFTPFAAKFEVAPVSSQGGFMQLAVTATANGGFAVNWANYDPDNGTYSVAAQLFDALGSAASPIVMLDESAAGGANGGDITLLADGNLLVTWSGRVDWTDQNVTSVIGQIIDATGAIIGAPFPVTLVPNQYYSEVVGLADGGFAATYLGMVSGPVNDWSVKSRAFALTAQPGTSANDIIVARQDFSGPIDGLGGDDYLAGNDASNVLHGGEGNDTIKGASGNDTIDGGAHIDTAVFSGVAAGYQILDDGPLGRRVIDIDPGNGDEGTDTLTGIEAARFADQTIVFAIVPPEITSDGGGDTAALSIAENGVTVTTVISTNPEVGNPLTFSIDGGADAGLFQIDSLTGQLRFIAPPNFEMPTDAGGNNVYDVIVRASTSTAFDTQAISVTVTDANDTPQGGGPEQQFTAVAGTPYTLLAADLLANISDEDGDVLSVRNLFSADGSVVDNGGGSFTITFPAYGNGSASLSYEAWDGRGGTLFANADFRILPGNNSTPGAANDLFGQGDLDIVLANWNGLNQVWANNGGTWLQTQALASSTTHDVALGDLDGDGDLDLFAVNGGSDKIFLNDGTGQFTATAQNLSSLRGMNAGLGDIDSDGDLDAFVVNTSGGAEEIWANDGAGSFSLLQSLAGGDSNEVALGDLDGDGDLDAIVTNANHDSYVGEPDRVYINNAGTFVQGQSLGNSVSSGIALGDVDGDGDLDAFISTRGILSEDLWLNNGDGTFVYQQVTGGVLSGWDVELGDLDGDGDLDAVVASGRDSAPSRIMFNDGAGNFTADSQALTNYAMAVSLGDLDGDGDLDIVFETDNYVSPNNTPRAWINNGSGSFTIGPVIGNTSINSVGGALGDLDGDGGLNANATHILDVLANDRDRDGDQLRITEVAGQAIIDGGAAITLASGALVSLSGGKLVFNPTGSALAEGLAPGELGIETFTYAVSDPSGASSEATVRVRLVGVANDDPVAVDDNLAGFEDQTLTIDPAALTGNDSDPDGNPLRVSSVSNAIGGVVGLTPNGQISFAPAPEFSGNASFDYLVVDDNGGSDTGHVTIAIAAVNDRPVNSVPGPQTVLEDGALVFSTANGNAITTSDIDNGLGGIVVTVQAVGGLTILGAAVQSGIQGVTGNFSGTVLVNNNGGSVISIGGLVADVNLALQGLIFRPLANATGSVEITVTANDNGASGSGGLQRDIDTIAITITPVNDNPTGTVTLSGDAVEGSVLTISHTLADADGLGVFWYQWYTKETGILIAGASGPSYTLTQADVGHQIVGVVRFTDGFGQQESNDSLPTAAVQNFNDAPTGSVTISGSAIEDQVLTASNTLADEDGIGAISYQWLRDGKVIDGANAATYTIGQAGVGHQFSVEAGYTDGHGTTEVVTSSSTDTVANINDAPTGAVTITGNAIEGQVLSASNTLADEDGLGPIGYQWLRNGTAIAGATGSTYTLVQADVGRQIAVLASYIDGQGTTESVTSGATAAVANINDAPNGIVLAGGSVAENAANGTVVGTFTGQDEDLGEVLTYALLNNAGGRFAINTATGQLTVAAGNLLNFELAQSYQVTVRVTDAALASYSQVFTIDLTNVVESQNPPMTQGVDFFTAPSADDWTIDGRNGNDTITTLGGIDRITGGGGDDTIATDGGNDIIMFQGAASGYDSIDAGEGADTILAQAKNTVIGLKSLAGVETISAAGSSGVYIQGWTGSETFDFSGITLTNIASIRGGAGNDTIVGSAAADTIFGEAGADILAGGGGSDTFVFAALGDSTIAASDVILDFNRAEGDMIDLQLIDAIAGGKNNAFAWGDTTARANGVWYSTDGTNSTVFVDRDGNPATAEMVFLLNDVAFLQSTDFIL